MHLRNRPLSSGAMTSTRLIPILLLALWVPFAGCASRQVSRVVYEKDDVTATLRSREQRGKPIDRGFQHPASISKQRLARILSTIHIRGKGDSPDMQRTAIASDLIFPIANALSAALAEADPTQDVAVIAIRKGSHLKVFTRKYLTSFTAFVRDDALFILLSRVEWDMDEAKGKRNKKVKVPEPDPTKEQMEFRTVATVGLASAGRQGVAASWRDAYWSRMETLRKADGGQIRRRTVLEESNMPVDIPTRPDDATLPASPDALRDLADLEEERQAGRITEQEYQRRRKQLLD